MDMEDTLTTSADSGSFGNALSAGLEVRPTDFLDGWWLHEATKADYAEFTYATRHTALGALEPTTLEGILPEGAQVVRRVFFTSMKKQDLMVAYEDSLVAMSVSATWVWMAVAARDAKHAAYVKDALLDAFPEGEDIAAVEAKVPFFVWTAGSAALGGGRLNPLKVDPWEEIRDNYAPETGSALTGLFDGFEPGKGGSLLLWHGVPGTGKSHALGALAHAWRSWCATHYVADPEALLGDPDYLLTVTLEPVKPPREWKLIILEDTSELLTADASARTGHALSRLLNVTDGMLGQGSNTLFLITTNEPLGSFHEAVARPGRCASQVEFLAMSAAQGTEWLRAHGAPSELPALRAPAALADLYAMLEGDQVAPSHRRGPVGFAPGEVA